METHPTTTHPATPTPRRRARLAACTAVLLLGLAPSGCDDESPTATEPDPDFPVWHQGFESGTEGWYGAATEGPLGWCGSIERHGEGGGAAPSAGSGRATLRTGPCNAFWTERGVPFGVPYGPGPELSLYSDAWPTSGYVTELDVYLDPAWAADFQGNLAPETLILYGTTVFPREWSPGDFHTAPHWLVAVDRADGGGGLTVLGRPVTAAGWYTFRFRYRDEGGQVRVDFELDDTGGATVVSESALVPLELQGPQPPVPFADPLPTADYGSGHVWFMDLAAGLALPIDEHRMRPGA